MLRLLTLLLVALATGSPAGSQVLEHNLFHIKRNKNLNEVHYKGRSTGCNWEASQPLRVHWRRLGEGQARDEELNFIEKSQAYGVAIGGTSRKEVRFHVVSMPEVEILAAASEVKGRCAATATTIIQGQSATLTMVYVHATEGLLLPTVNYITFYGCRNGAPVSQRIVKSPLAGTAQTQAESNERTRVGPGAVCRLAR
jgi:hypothetical protein